MARIAIPNYPHHIAQRSNKQQNVFVNKNDYQQYIKLLKHHCNKEQIEI